MVKFFLVKGLLSLFLVLFLISAYAVPASANTDGSANGSATGSANGSSDGSATGTPDGPPESDIPAGSGVGQPETGAPVTLGSGVDAHPPTGSGLVSMPHGGSGESRGSSNSFNFGSGSFHGSSHISLGSGSFTQGSGSFSPGSPGGSGPSVTLGTGSSLGSTPSPISVPDGSGGPTGSGPSVTLTTGSTPESFGSSYWTTGSGSMHPTPSQPTIGSGSSVPTVTLTTGSTATMGSTPSLTVGSGNDTYWTSGFGSMPSLSQPSGTGSTTGSTLPSLTQPSGTGSTNASTPTLTVPSGTGSMTGSATVSFGSGSATWTYTTGSSLTVASGTGSMFGSGTFSTGSGIFSTGSTISTGSTAPMGSTPSTDSTSWTTGSTWVTYTTSGSGAGDASPTQSGPSPTSWSPTTGSEDSVSPTLQPVTSLSTMSTDMSTDSTTSVPTASPTQDSSTISMEISTSAPTSPDSVDPCSLLQCPVGSFCAYDVASSTNAECLCDDTVDCSFGDCVVENFAVVCDCFDGYTGNSCDMPVCDLGCGMGTCVSPNECECADGSDGGSDGSSCEEPVSTPGETATLTDDTTAAPSTTAAPTSTTAAPSTSYMTSPTEGCDCVYGSCNTLGICVCDDGYSGLLCDTSICPDGYYYMDGTCVYDYCDFLGDYACSFHGQCTNTAQYYECSCDSGYEGTYCSDPVCSNDCSGNGDCVGPEECSCYCDWSATYCWSGDECDVPDCSALNNCNDHGTCTDLNVCECDGDYSGDACDLLSCPNDCSNHGTLKFHSEGVYGCDGTTGECTCSSGYTGDDCSTVDTSVVLSCPYDCSDIAGACVKPDYVCDCPETHFGAGCENLHCPGYDEDCDITGECDTYCNSYGSCSHIYGLCSCYGTAYGDACQYHMCDIADDGTICNSRGSCDASTGLCKCRGDYFGDNCEYDACPTDSRGLECSGQGTCNYGTGTCECADGYWGSYCQHLECPAGNNGKMCSGNGSPFIITSGVKGCNGVTGECTCRSGWTNVAGDLLYSTYSGEACGTATCPTLYSGLQCSGNGYCNNGVCSCDMYDADTPLFIGDACQTENPDAVPEGESVVVITAPLGMEGVSQLTYAICLATYEATVATLVGDSDNINVIILGCEDILAAGPTTAPSTAAPSTGAPSESTVVMPSARRMLQSTSLGVSLQFVTNSQGGTSTASASSMSASITSSSADLANNVASEVETQTGQTVTIDSSSIVPAVSCPGACSGNGVCDTTTGTCSCNTGWTHKSCKLPACYDDSLILPTADGESMFEGCNYNGECDTPDTCSCYDGYSGDRCDQLECLVDDDDVDCSGNGSCLVPEECTCFDENTDVTTCVDTVPYCGELVDLCFEDGYDDVRDNCMYTCTVQSIIDSVSLDSYTSLASACAEVTYPAVSYYEGDICEDTSCSGCSGRGTCEEPWVCTCEDGYVGDNCSEMSCIEDDEGNDCSNHGSCRVPDYCTCDSGWTGTDCSTPDCSGCAEIYTDSAAHYTCSEPYTGDASVCECEDGYEGDQCTDIRCDLDICTDCEIPDVCASCVDDAATGDECQYKKDCPSSDAGPCNGNGGCLTAGECTCYETEYGSYEGDECDIIPCDDVDSCSGHGECREPNVCSCEKDDLGRPLYTGDTCSEMVCPTDDDGVVCSGHGTCTEPRTCECENGYTGSACETDVCDDYVCNPTQTCVRTSADEPSCVTTCLCLSDHGSCEEGSTTCDCFAGYFGPDCSETSAATHYVTGSISLGSMSAAAFDESLQLQVASGLAAIFNVDSSSVVIDSVSENSDGSLEVSFTVYDVSSPEEAADSFSALSSDDLSDYIGLPVTTNNGADSVTPVETTASTGETAAEDSEGGDDDKGGVIGGAVGGAVGGMALMLMIMFLMKKRRSSAPVAAMPPAQPVYNQQPPMQQYPQQPTYPQQPAYGQQPQQPVYGQPQQPVYGQPQQPV
eukprot:Rmarinus@m.26736